MAFKVGKGKSPLGSRNRKVILIGDDGVVLYAVEKKKAIRVVALSWDAPDFEQKLISAIKSGYSGDIILLYDAVEQHYRKDRIPKVGAMDKRKVINRKLNLAFPNFTIKSALPLKDGRKGGGLAKRKPPNANDKPEYLFAALPRSDILTRVIEALYEVEAGIVGLGLMPVESVSLVDALADLCVEKKGSARSGWTVMIGQHETGGLYQIVTHKGNLAMRRLTPVAERADGTGIAGDIAREFKATLSYIARFGYSSNDGLDLVIVAPKSEHNALSMANLQVSNLCMLDLPEALNVLGGQYEGETVKTYSDALHALWAAKSQNLVMPMRIPELQKVSTPRKIAQMGILVTVLAVLGLLYLNYSSYQEYNDRQDMIEFKTTQRNALQREYEEESSRFDELPIPPQTVANTIAIKNMLQNNSIDMTPILELLHSNVNSNFIVETLRVEHDPDEDVSLATIGQAEQASNPNPYAAAVTQMFNPDGTPVVEPETGTLRVYFTVRPIQPNVPLEELVNLSEGLLETLRLTLPDHTIDIERQFAGVSRTGSFSVSASDEDDAENADNAAASAESLTADFVIEGPPL